MAKRFTATEKWDDPWFFQLDANYKLAWMFLLDKCNHAGILTVNRTLMQVYLGFMPTIEAFRGRVQALSEEKWFIPKFIEFQYGTLKRENRAHQSVISILEKEGASKGLTSPMQGAKDKDKDKAMVKESLSLNKKMAVEEARAGDILFGTFWQEYPRKIAKPAAKRAWDKLRPNEELLRKMIEAVKGWRRSDQWQKDGGEFIPHPATWLNQRRWEDEIPKGVSNGNARRGSDLDRLVDDEAARKHEKGPVGEVPKLFR